jgi:DNA mismatch repair protein MutL
VPHLLGQPRFSSFFVELFDLLTTDANKDEISIVKKIISMSCKKAVKAGDKLSNEEIRLLIKNISDEEIPLTCPHGRPFVMRITKKQIDKKAGRIN